MGSATPTGHDRRMDLIEARALVERHERMCGKSGPPVGFLEGNREAPICAMSHGHAGACHFETWAPHRARYCEASRVIGEHEAAQERAEHEMRLRAEGVAVERARIVAALRARVDEYTRSDVHVGYDAVTALEKAARDIEAGRL